MTTAAASALAYAVFRRRLGGKRRSEGVAFAPVVARPVTALTSAALGRAA